MIDVTETYREFLAEHMDERGHLAGGPHHCSRCGRELSGPDGPRPAETYLGTLNGLCYPCTSSGPYVVARYPWDGAQLVSWPPHCPSWRRTREEFHGYPGCETCAGLGATRGYGQWTPIWERCRDCSARFWAARPDFEYERWARRAAEAVWRQRTDALVPRKVRGKAKREAARIELIDSGAADGVRTVLVTRYQALAGRIKARYAERWAREGAMT